MRTIRTVLLYCTIINYCLVSLWFVIIKIPHTWLYNMSSLGTSPEEFDRINLTGIVYYKMAVILFNLVPCVSLYLVKLPKSSSDRSDSVIE